MNLKSRLSRPFAKIVGYQQAKWAKSPEIYQNKIRKHLINKATNTIFGRDHQFEKIQSYQEFKEAIPIRDYEKLQPYIHKIFEGANHVLWPGKPIYFSKTSGTTSGSKFIPITKESIHNHIRSARNALLSYIAETNRSDFLKGKLIFLSGSPNLTTHAGIPTGRLSGIVNHHVPNYLRSNQMPTYPTNCIDDWEEKIDHIVDETMLENMTLISGIPPWVQMYFQRLIDKKGGLIKDIFPNFSLFVYGGVNFEPYRSKLYETIGKKIDAIELYPASEGFIAYQDSQYAKGMLLLTNSGIFFEFIPVSEFHNEKPTRLSIAEVEINVNYVIILHSNAGLWGYILGDTVKFLSTYPHRLVVTGRIKHFISAFGEHVIGEEVENAMKNTCDKFPKTEILEFTVAPQVNPSQGLPYHEWLIAFASNPENISSFEDELDQQLRNLNAYYDDLISGGVLKKLVITPLEPEAFIKYMKSIGKLGGQNKMPRLSNDRKIADDLIKYRIHATD